MNLGIVGSISIITCLFSSASVMAVEGDDATALLSQPKLRPAQQIPQSLSGVNQTQSLTHSAPIFADGRQQLSVIAGKDPFFSVDVNRFHPELAQEKATSVTGLNYSYSSIYGLTQIKVITDNQHMSSHVFDVSYGYPLAFAEQRGLVQVNLGADYLNYGSADITQYNQLKADTDNTLSPYFSVDGFWKLNHAWQWRYNFKYQLTDEQRNISKDFYNDTSIIIYTGVDFKF